MNELPKTDSPDTAREALENALHTVPQSAPGAMCPEGFWEGRLSSSALSTATAVSALALADTAGRRAPNRFRRPMVVRTSKCRRRLGRYVGQSQQSGHHALGRGGPEACRVRSRNVSPRSHRLVPGRKLSPAVCRRDSSGACTGHSARLWRRSHLRRTHSDELRPGRACPVGRHSQFTFRAGGFSPSVVQASAVASGQLCLARVDCNRAVDRPSQSPSKPPAAAGSAGPSRLGYWRSCGKSSPITVDSWRPLP